MSKENNLHDFLTDLADSIREVEGSTDPINPQDFSDRVKGLGTGGGSGTLDAYFEGSLTEVTSNATKVKNFAFYKHTSLTSVNFPNATSIGAYAFEDCTALTTVYAPNATYIYNYVFQDCTALTTVYAPNATYIYTNAFSYCTALTTLDLPNVSTLYYNAFDRCTGLKSLSLPSVTSIPTSAFYGCGSLTKLIIGTNLTTVATLEDTDAFDNCNHILGKVSATTNPDGLKDGYIYVPDNLVSRYKIATNWSAFASQIKGISELPTEE